MAKNEILAFCKLFNPSQKDNPYKVDYDRADWKDLYLKHHIWNAENEAYSGYDGWKDVYVNEFHEEPSAEDIYKMSIMDKLRKMSNYEDIDFYDMYYKLKKEA